MENLTYEDGFVISESAAKKLTSYKVEKTTISEYLWETNFQQKPTDPESLFFSYNRIRTYDKTY